jgi:transposase
MRIFVGLDPVDMRKSFDGLAAEVRRQLARDPLAGHLYVFVNRPRTHAKMLLFERAGYWIFYRRLERGTFQLPAARDASRGVEIDPAALALILEGIDLRTAKRRLRYERPTGAPASW